MNEIRKSIFRGSLYFASAKYVSVLFNIIVVSVLARVLTPSDFGLVAITSVFISFFDILANMGFGPAIIQNKTLRESDLSDLYTLFLYLSIVLALAFFMLAAPISYFYSDVVLVNIVRLLSIQVFFISLNVLPYALLLKAKKFKLLSVVNICNTVVLGVLSILLALFGFGIYSLLVMPIGGSILLCIVCRVSIKEKIFFVVFPKIEPLYKILSFSMYQFSFNIVNYFSRNLDKILIGKVLDMSVLGFYEKSYRLMMMPISNLTSVIAPTIQPILSEYQNDKRVQIESYYSISKLLLCCGAVLTPFLFFSSEYLILIFFGDQWGGAIPIFRILSLSVIFQIIDSLTGSILQSANSIKYLFVSGLICAIVNVLMLIVGLLVFKDIIVTSILIDISFFVNFLISIYYINLKAFNSGICQYLKLLIFPMVLIGIISVLLYFTSFLNLSITLSLFLNFAISVVVAYFMISVSCYFNINYYFKRAFFYIRG